MVATCLLMVLQVGWYCCLVLDVTPTNVSASPTTLVTSQLQADVQSVNGQTGAVVLDADDIDDTSTTHKFVSAAEITSISTDQPYNLVTMSPVLSMTPDTSPVLMVVIRRHSGYPGLHSVPP